MKKKGIKMFFKNKMKSSHMKRKIKYNFLMFIFIFLSFFIMIFLNLIVGVLVSKYDIKIDLTSSGLYKISKETKEFLKNYDKDVRLILLNDEEGFKRSDDVYASHIYNISKNFAACSPHISLEFVNLNEHPNFASKYANLSLQQNGILLVGQGDKSRFIPVSKMFQSSYDPQDLNNQVEVVSSVEKNIAHNLEFLAGQDVVKILNITGHKEVELDRLKDSIFKENGYDVVDFNLLTTKVSDDVDAIMIVAPTIDYGKEEIEKLNKLYGSGKKIIYFASALQPKLKNLEEFMYSNFGISFSDGVLVETDPNRMSLNSSNDIFTYVSEENKYVENMSTKKLPINFNDCRPIEIKKTLKDVEMVKICETQNTSAVFLKKDSQFDVDGAEKKSFPLALGFTKKLSSNKNAKFTVFASAYILAGMAVPQLGNGEFVLNTLGETVEHKSKVKILPKVIGIPQLTISKLKSNILGFVFIIVFPLVVVVVGFIIYFKRKRRWKNLKNLKKIVVVSFFVLVGLVCVYFVVSKQSVEKETNRTYFMVDGGLIKKIKVQKDGENEFVVLKYGIDDLTNVPLDRKAIDELFGFVSKIEADRVFVPKEKLSEYGLDKPSFKFVVSGKNVNFVLKVGKKTFAQDGYYVGLRDGENEKKEIAVVRSEFVEQILKSKLSYVDLKLIKPYEKTFGEDKQYNGDGVQKCSIEGKRFKNKLEFTVNEKGEVVASSKNFKLTNKIKDFIEKGPKFLVAKEVFSVKPSQDQVEKCGLKTPTAKISYVIDHEKYLIRIGKVFKVEQLPNFDGRKGVNSLKYYYVLMEGRDVIYILSENVLPWLELVDD